MSRENNKEFTKAEIDFMLKSPIIFDEKRYGEYLYKNRTSTVLVPKVYTVKELTVLVKFLRTEITEDKEEVKKELIKFCQLNWIGFESEIEYERINKAMQEGYATKLREYKPIPITKSEWQAIKLVSEEKWQKWLFGILVIAKFNRLNPIMSEEEVEKSFTDTRLRCNLSEQDLSKIMKIRFVQEIDNLKAYREYSQYELLELPFAKKLKRILNFGELNPNESDILLRVENYYQIPYYYDKLNENPLLRTCITCGDFFLVNSEKSRLRRCKFCKPLNKEEKEKEFKKYPYKKNAEEENKVKRSTCIDCGKVFTMGTNVISYEDGEAIEKKVRCKECQRKYSYQKKLKGDKNIICESCGKPSQISSKRKKMLCNKCYSKELSSKGKKVIICDSCYEETIVSSKTKRTMCDECYKEYRKKYKKDKALQFSKRQE